MAKKHTPDEEEPKLHDHDHDHDDEDDEDGDDDDDLVVLADEDGVEATYRFLGVVEVDGEQFALLSGEEEPEDEEEPMEVFILRYAQDEDGGETFSPLDDEALFQRVQAEAERLFNQAPEAEA